MIGTRYWSTGIIVARHDANRWSAEVKFFDDGFCDNGSSEGVLRARYLGPLSHVVDLVKADAERLGIRWGATPDLQPSIYYDGDGERSDLPPPPPNWCALVNAEAARLGWRQCYAPEPKP